jgi:hypothetical protein
MILRRTRRRWAAVTLAMCVALISPSSQALEAEVSSTTAAQGYSLRSPWGDPILMRRRFMQTLGLTVTNITGQESAPSDIEVTFRSRMRLDADFGIGADEVKYSPGPGSFVPGLSAGPVDLMYAYVEARKLARGLLSGRLGRQYVIDSLGWWSLDGALMRVELPVPLAFETYGGFEQRGGLPLSTPRFERDGVWRGDRALMDSNLYPEFIQSSPAPAYGAVVETFGLSALHVRAAYRKVWNTGTVATRPLLGSPLSPPATVSGMRISSERFGANADLTLESLGELRVGAIYDLYASLLSSYFGTVDAYPAQWLTVGADFDRYVPVFDGDSIWNWFSTYPMTTWTGRADISLGRRWTIAGSGGLRWVESSDAASASNPATSLLADVLARVGSRYRGRSCSAGISGTVETGERGKRRGADVFAEKTLQDRYVVLSRLSLYDWDDALRPDRSATSFGYVLGAGYRPGPRTNVLVEWEHDTNRLVGQRYRVMAWLQMVVAK